MVWFPIVAIIVIITAFCLRVGFVIRSIHRHNKTASHEFSSILEATQAIEPSERLNFVQELGGGVKKSYRIMSVLGSGGHTTEMHSLLSTFKRASLLQLTYVLASSDSTSFTRTDHFERKVCEVQSTQPRHIFIRIPRSREVKQSYFTSVFSTLYALVFSLLIVMKEKPDLILVNGPGTCLPICYSGFFLRLLGICKPSIIYVESFTRVQKLSLTGKLVYPIASRFIVQWPELAEKHKRAEYIGLIC